MNPERDSLTTRPRCANYEAMKWEASSYIDGLVTFLDGWSVDTGWIDVN